MKNKITIILSTITFTLILLNPLKADFIFLKEGSILNCTVKTEYKHKIIVKDKNGKLITVQRDDILRVRYAKLYMGKLFIRLTSGKVLSGYMVDESGDEYTFRKELYKPEEFKLKRDKVLFTARKNPNELEGKVELNHIKLKWKASYGKVKYYKVYVKVKGGKYKYTGKTDKKQTKKTIYTIRGLKDNLKYICIVRALDEEGYESLPSNEVEVNIAKVSEAVKKMQNVGVSNVQMMLSGSYLMPIRNMSEILSPGYGTLLNVSFKDLLIKNLLLGIDTGFFYFSGNREDVDKTYMVPFLLSVQYRFNILKSLSILPKVSAGGSYNVVSSDEEVITLNKEPSYYNESSFQPVASAGVVVSYLIGSQYIINIGADYRGIFEADGIVDFISFNAGFGTRFQL